MYELVDRRNPRRYDLSMITTLHLLKQERNIARFVPLEDFGTDVPQLRLDMTAQQWRDMNLPNKITVEVTVVEPSGAKYLDPALFFAGDDE